MIQSIKKFLGLRSIEERIQEYLSLEEQEAIEKSNRDQLAISYAEHTRILDLSKGETDEFVKEKVQDKYNAFFSEYKKELIKAKDRYEKLKNKREKLLKNEEFAKAVKLHKAHQKFTAKEISLKLYDSIIKAVTKEDVRYADSIVFNSDNKILILQRAQGDENAGKWVIPGGHIDPNESFEEAAKRELREESGINVDEKGLVHPDAKNIFCGEYKKEGVHIKYFKTYLQKDPSILLDDDETHAYKWVTVSELDDHEMVYNMKANIQKILQPWKEQVVKLTKAFQNGIIKSEDVFQAAMLEVLKKAKYSDTQQKKIEQVMGEFKAGTLKHGSTGEIVTDRKVALAIALSEAGVNKAEKIEKGGLSEGLSLEDIAKKHKIDIDILKQEYNKGKEVEKEHTDDEKEAAQIALDHLVEDPKYYTKLATIEKSEDDEIDFEKARSGVYADNPLNRKLKRVGQKYGSKQTEDGSSKEAKKQDDKKPQERQDLDEAAKEASGSALETAAKEAKDAEVRTAAHKELQRREKEEKPQEDDKVDTKAKDTDTKNKESEVTEPYTLAEARRISELGKVDPEQAIKEAQEYVDLYSEEAKDPKAQRFGTSVKDIKAEYERVIDDIQNERFPRDLQADYDELIKRELFKKEVSEISEEDADLMISVAKQAANIRNKTALFNYMTGYFSSPSKAREFVNKYNPF